MRKRACGVLLHITSLPSKFGIGDLGHDAYRFADFLFQAKQSLWQVLPLNPPVPASYSPYNCLSAFAGNSLVISPEMLYRDGFLNKADIRIKGNFPKAMVDFATAIGAKIKLLNSAYENFKKRPKDDSYNKFCEDNKYWLKDYAIFIALRGRYHNRSWADWPRELRDRNKQAINAVSKELHDAIERESFFQYIFFRQYGALKAYCKQRSIKIIGDIPIYVSHDSADVWAHPEIFKLTKQKRPRFIAGVPPDTFSPVGQLWGNPVYNWRILERTGYRWWLRRITHQLGLFDMVRLDHFRGLVRYWQVRADAKSAQKGRWVKVPSEDFFNHIKGADRGRIIIEDLGYITADVQAIIDKFNLTCTRVLLGGFYGDPKKNPHSLKNHIENSVVYSGTHDTNTARGWFEKEANEQQKKQLFELIGRKVSGGQLRWEMIKLAFSSAGRLAIIPMQDILGLGVEARMNVPGTTEKNWVWRMSKCPGGLQISGKLADLAATYGRISS